jgi:uncharacterized protein YjdB
VYRGYHSVSRVLLLLSFIFSLTSCCGQFFKGPQDLTGISVSPDGNTIQAGTTQQFSATGTFQYNNGPTGDVTPQTTWTSSDPTIVTIDSNGLATGVAFGTVTIKGSCDCFNAKALLTVSNQSVSLTSITISPAAETMSVGDTQQFTAMADYSNNTSADITSSVSWTSSSTSVATIDRNGLATAVASGTATITATSGGISGSTTVTVRAQP